MRSAYDILGVQTSATLEEIRSAYKALARDQHPDQHGGSTEATERFLEIRAAYETLKDPERRRAHDADPERAISEQLEEQRLAQRKRRRERLKRLYED